MSSRSRARRQLVPVVGTAEVTAAEICQLKPTRAASARRIGTDVARGVASVALGGGGGGFSTARVVVVAVVEERLLLVADGEALLDVPLVAVELVPTARLLRSVVVTDAQTGAAVAALNFGLRPRAHRAILEAAERG